MTKKIRLFLIAGIVLLAFAGALFTQRVQITEYLHTLDQPELPDAVSYEQVRVEDSVDGVEEIQEEVLPPAETDSEAREGVELEPGDEASAMPDEEPQDLPQDEQDDLPAEINLAVPFTSQAPHANWELPYQEACEEASVLMVHEYYRGTKEGLLDADDVDEAILNLTAFQEELFGNALDTTAAQTAIFASQYYGYGRVDVIENPTVTDMKKHLVAGRPVIIPAAGQRLGNPYFTQPGPVYHMLVVRGYTSKGFITNDPGTKRGEGYVYSFDAIMNAMHDWNDGDVPNGAKVALVIYPEQ